MYLLFALAIGCSVHTPTERERDRDGENSLRCSWTCDKNAFRSDYVDPIAYMRLCPVVPASELPQLSLV